MPTTVSEQTTTMSERLVAAVCAARRRKGWTRETLAHHSGLSYAAITQIEQQRRTDVRISTVIAIADALDISIDFLLGRQPSPALRHYAGLFRDDDELAASALAFLAQDEGLDKRVLVVASERSREVIKDFLGEGAGDYPDVTSWYDNPAEANRRYLAFAREAQLSGVPWIGIIGEPIWEGRPRPEVDAWSRYESLLNLTFASWPMNILCLYDGKTARRQVVESAWCTHPELYVRGALERSTTYAEPEEFVTIGTAAGRGVSKT
jgi:transcriptional regulator with XRE-family HTH domain